VKVKVKYEELNNHRMVVVYMYDKKKEDPSHCVIEIPEKNDLPFVLQSIELALNSILIKKGIYHD
jgi:hypothetical protein